jgi:hypothetical protein
VKECNQSLFGEIFSMLQLFKKWYFLGAYFWPSKCHKVSNFEKIKNFPKGKPSLDGLPLLKTKDNIIAKSLGHPEVRKLYIIKQRVL